MYSIEAIGKLGPDGNMKRFASSSSDNYQF